MRNEDTGAYLKDKVATACERDMILRHHGQVKIGAVVIASGAVGAVRL